VEICWLQAVVAIRNGRRPADFSRFMSPWSRHVRTTGCRSPASVGKSL